MGWCPNANNFGTNNNIHPKYFVVSNQARGKDVGNSPVLSSTWWDKRHNRALIISLGLTLIPIFGIGFQGIGFGNEALIMGLITGIIFNLLFCILDWHSLEKAKDSTKTINRYSTSTKMRIITSLLSLILLDILLLQFEWEPTLTFIFAFCFIALAYYFKLDSIPPLIVLLSIGSRTGFEHTLAFVSGYCLTAFLFYVETIYWEKKNKMVVLVYRHKNPGVYLASTGVDL